MGGAGVALAAAAAHSGGGDEARASALFLMIHAAALLGISAHAAQAGREGFRRALLVSGLGLGLAASLFSADLAARSYAGGRLFTFAAPIGGTGMIVFWLGIAGLFTYAALRRVR